MPVIVNLGEIYDGDGLSITREYKEGHIRVLTTAGGVRVGVQMSSGVVLRSWNCPCDAHESRPRTISGLLPR